MKDKTFTYHFVTEIESAMLHDIFHISAQNIDLGTRRFSRVPTIYVFSKNKKKK